MYCVVGDIVDLTNLIVAINSSTVQCPLICHSMRAHFHLRVAESSTCLIGSCGDETLCSCICTRHYLDLCMTQTWDRESGKQLRQDAEVTVTFFGKPSQEDINSPCLIRLRQVCIVVWVHARVVRVVCGLGSGRAKC